MKSAKPTGYPLETIDKFGKDGIFKQKEASEVSATRDSRLSDALLSELIRIASTPKVKRSNHNILSTSK